LEWSGTSLNAVFSQRRNLLNPRFWRMLRDVLRFNRLATDIALRNAESELMQPLKDYLQAHRFSSEFTDWYFLPMLGCIWSCPTAQMLEFPVATMIRFCHNHGLIQVSNRPQWHTVAGGARHYVDKIVASVADKRLNCPVQQIRRDADGVSVTSAGQTERFDKVVIATHSDQALALLADASAQERATLGAIGYQANRAVLHTDASVLPQHKRAWAAWNYQRAQHNNAAGKNQGESQRVCLHYLLNLLQPLPFAQPVVVSLNPLQDVDPQHVLGSYDYAHPVFDLAAIRAQTEVPALQGQQHTYFCGAWTGYGFHEDGLKSGLDVATRLRPLLV
jgi:predicted NAD/FAD-binding protein